MSRRNRRCLGNLLLDLVIFFIRIFRIVIQPTLMFLFEVPCHVFGSNDSIRRYCLYIKSLKNVIFLVGGSDS